MPSRPFILKSCLLLLCLAAFSGLRADTVISINDPTFDSASGKLSGIIDLNTLDSAPGALTLRLGTSPWYGMAYALVIGNTGFRPGIEVNQILTSAGSGSIRYGLGLLGALSGEMPDAYLWQPLTGTGLAANTAYKLQVDVDSGILMDANAFAARGFGIGITTGASASSYGSFFADSLSGSGNLSVQQIGLTTDRLTLSFTTGSNPVAGDLGITFFAGRGTQQLLAGLLANFNFDNVNFTSQDVQAVPEPRSAGLAALGAFCGLLRVRLRRR